MSDAVRFIGSFFEDPLYIESFNEEIEKKAGLLGIPLHSHTSQNKKGGKKEEENDGMLMFENEEEHEVLGGRRNMNISLVRDNTCHTR